MSLTPKTSGARRHERDARYVVATLHPSELTRPLADRLRPPFAAVKAARRATEDAEDECVEARASREVADFDLDSAVIDIHNTGAQRDRTDPRAGILARLALQDGYSSVTTLPHEQELIEVARLGERATTLDEADPIRNEKAPLLAKRAATLKAALRAHDKAEEKVSLCRARERTAVYELRRALGRTSGALIEMFHGDVKAAARYFPKGRRPKRGDSAPEPAPEPEPKALAPRDPRS